MKKLVSLLLALILGLCTLGASAEAAVPAPTFDLDIQSYQALFNPIVASVELSPVWLSTEDGLTHICQVEDYPAVIVVTDAAGSIASISISADLTSSNVSTMGNNFGEMIAYASMSAMMFIDNSYLNDVDAFVSTILSLFTSCLSQLGMEPVTVSITTNGAVFTCTVSSLDLSSLSYSITFSMTPAAAE